MNQDYRLSLSTKERVSQDTFDSFHIFTFHKRIAKLSFCADSTSVSSLNELHKTFNSILNNRKHSVFPLLAPFAGSMARVNPGANSGSSKKKYKKRSNLNNLVDL